MATGFGEALLMVAEAYSGSGTDLDLDFASLVLGRGFERFEVRREGSYS